VCGSISVVDVFAPRVAADGEKQQSVDVIRDLSANNERGTRILSCTSSATFATEIDVTVARCKRHQVQDAAIAFCFYYTYSTCRTQVEDSRGSAVIPLMRS
jgi:hypothetical protein